MDAIQITPFDRKVAWFFGARGNHDRIEGGFDLVKAHILADFARVTEFYPFGRKLVDAPLDLLFT